MLKKKGQTIDKVRPCCSTLLGAQAQLPRPAQHGRGAKSWPITHAAHTPSVTTPALIHHRLLPPAPPGAELCGARPAAGGPHHRPLGAPRLGPLLPRCVPALGQCVLASGCRSATVCCPRLCLHCLDPQPALRMPACRLSQLSTCCSCSATRTGRCREVCAPQGGGRG